MWGMPKEHAVMDDAPPRETPASAPAPESPEAAAAPADVASPPPDPASLAPAIEAILLTVDKPVPAARLAEALGLAAPAPPPADQPGTEQPTPAPRKRSRKAAPATGEPLAAAELIGQAVEILNRVYSDTGRAFRIEQVAGGYRVMTLPDFAPILAAFHKSRSSSRLSRAAVETLAIIAYRQPLTRAHLEAIRGVGCGEVLRSLMERKLVTIKGRAEELGRPILYGTTREFLDAFGLASLKDLPSASELQIG
jgi:segregation and condensation protein B